jgi:hypothetical protein
VIAQAVKASSPRKSFTTEDASVIMSMDPNTWTKCCVHYVA